MDLTLEQQQALRMYELQAQARQRQGVSTRTEDVQGAIEEVNTGFIARNPLALAVDFANEIMRPVTSAIGLYNPEPLFGSRQMQRSLSYMGAARDPDLPQRDDLAARAIRLGGESAGLAATMGAAGGPAALRTMGGGAAPRTVGGEVMANAGRTMISNPAAMLAGEAMAGATAAAGGLAAEQLFPDSPVAQAMGELIGGGLTGLAGSVVRLGGRVASGSPLGQAFLAGSDWLSTKAPALSALRNITGLDNRARAWAIREIQGNAFNPERAVNNLGGEYLDLVTPFQRTRDPGLLALEQYMIEQNARMRGLNEDQIAAAVQQYKAEAAAASGGGVPVLDTRTYLETARDELEQMLDASIRAATGMADRRIATMADEGVTQYEAELVLAHELDIALDAARMQETELWAAVPLDEVVSTTDLRDSMYQLRKATPIVQQESIPNYFEGLLDDLRMRYADPDETAGLSGEDLQAYLDDLPDDAPIRELQALRSRLLDDAREAAVGSSHTPRDSERARMLYLLANGGTLPNGERVTGVLDVMGAQAGDISTDTGQVIRTALDFSRDVQDRFFKGTVADLLGTNATGAARRQASETLSTTVLGGGSSGDVAQDAIIRAMSQPAPDGSGFLGDPIAAESAISDFLRQEFVRSATGSDGEFSIANARTFQRQYERQLQELPLLRNQIEGAIETRRLADVARQEGTAAISGLNDPNVTRTAVFLQSNPRQEIATIAASADPGQLMQELARRTAADPTGRANEGLKTAMWEYMAQHAGTPRHTAEGDRILSGTELRRMIQEPGPVRDMIEALYSPDEVQNLMVIADSAEAIELGARALPITGVSGANPVQSAMAGILGAKTGAAAGQAVFGHGDIQTPGFGANLLRRLTEWGVKRPGLRILDQARRDREFLRELLQTTTQARPLVGSRVNAWLATVAAEQGIEWADDDEQAR